MPVDASQYRRRSDLTEDEIKALMKEGPITGPKYIDRLLKQSAEDWAIPSNKKGGKIKKCQPGDTLPQFSHTDIFGNPIVSQNFKFNSQISHTDPYKHAVKTALEKSD